MSVGMLIPERGKGDNNSRWVHVHYLMGEHKKQKNKNVTCKAESKIQSELKYRKYFLKESGLVSTYTVCW